MATCGAYFDRLPNSMDVSDPPGTKVDGKGVKWYPTDNPCKFCTGISGKGDCFEAIVPEGHKPDDLDPRVTPLSAFPRWPVEYYVVRHVGDTWSRVLMRQMYPDKPINRRHLEFFESLASTWIERASESANNATRKAWVQRLRVEAAKAEDAQRLPCLIDCRPQMQRLWLAANAGQYLARAWGDRESPPLLDVPSLGESTQKWALIILGIAVFGAGVYIAAKAS